MEPLKQLFAQFTGELPESVEELPSSGSNRRYFRMRPKGAGAGISGGPDTGGASLIGVQGSCEAENRAFWHLARHFRSKGLPVPEVYAHSDDFQYYIQQDLGSGMLFDKVAEGRAAGHYAPHEEALLIKSVQLLPKIQFEGGRGLDFSVCFPQPEFDAQTVAFDQNYFKYCFLKATGLEFDEMALEEDFRRMASILVSETGDTFMYRDFQSRNIMIYNGEPYLIDFQGGRRGPVCYDIASFVWQARANYDEGLRNRLVSAYIDSARRYTDIDEERFHARLRHFVLFRTLQVLGAYGFRGYFEKKPHFLQSIPYAVDNLRRLLATPFEEYPYLNSLLDRLTRMPEFASAREGQLEVEIYSFAFKKGIPDDNSGNGGGYVFDCRGLDNPGKYEHYRHFTGLDREVIDFLEERGEVHEFLSRIFPMAEAHVRRYIERKFTHLMFSFGCTGGQHRSVYCASRLAEYLSGRFSGIRIIVRHRELDKEIRL